LEARLTIGESIPNLVTTIEAYKKGAAASITSIIWVGPFRGEGAQAA
jgi:hypothetical protein